MTPSPHDLCLEAAAQGIRLQVAGDRLKVTPADRFTPDLIDRLREHKAELLA
ncbi:MAG: hypothetical protein JXQ71_10070 [Verrucomicrobia bacterium]|nr:hypothetical protein [Verrucomicrobiota bacterium]